jgi:hypothetical protein
VPLLWDDADLWQRWFAAAGVAVPAGVPVEVRPVFALDAAECAAKLPPGFRITEPTALG